MQFKIQMFSYLFKTIMIILIKNIMLRLKMNYELFKKLFKHST